ncbi:MAG: hypothetical protein IPP94_18995 [Ignavibacteria bacterium]|nr:hypothetical protein [Ignavibacteria bacterium]
MASEAIETLLDILDAFSANTLRDGEALARLLEHGQAPGKSSAVAALAFQGKYLTRVLDTIRKQPTGGEHLAKLEEEYARGLQEFRALLSHFVSDAPDALSAFVGLRYLPVSEEALRQLVDLTHDLGWLKEWELASADTAGETGS